MAIGAIVGGAVGALFGGGGASDKQFEELLAAHMLSLGNGMQSMVKEAEAKSKETMQKHQQVMKELEADGA